jgi:hypothetical protein
MILSIFIILSLIAAAVIAATEPVWWVSFIIFLPVAGFMMLLAFIFAALVSMWLGRKSKFKLRKSQSFKVVYHDSETLFCPETGETVYISELTETLSSAKITTPTLVVNYYNLTGWRYKWLMEMHPDTIEYILYLPSEDEAP